MARSHRKPKAAKRKTTVYIGKKTTRRRRVSGIGSTTHRRHRRRSVGATGGTLQNIGTLAIGMVGGALATHFALRPLENKLTAHYPQAGKIMGAVEILIGGFVAMKGKRPIIKGIGLGIMAGGVNTVMHQFNLGMASPAISGMDSGYQNIRIPISGSMTNLISGVFKDDNGRTANTSFVAGSSDDAYRNYILNGTMDGLSDPAGDLPPIGYNY